MVLAAAVLLRRDSGTVLVAASALEITEAARTIDNKTLLKVNFILKILFYSYIFICY